MPVETVPGQPTEWLWIEFPAGGELRVSLISTYQIPVVEVKAAFGAGQFSSAQYRLQAPIPAKRQRLQSQVQGGQSIPGESPPGWPGDLQLNA
ncbi:MAG: hypothetical protein D6753_07400 [Planctomycetota bacterium]|nr:MAG: hypothetical protein D6753_07400 [Planctomycetota bacterium]